MLRLADHDCGILEELYARALRYTRRWGERKLVFSELLQLNYCRGRRAGGLNRVAIKEERVTEVPIEWGICECKQKKCPHHRNAALQSTSELKFLCNNCEEYWTLSYRRCYRIKMCCLKRSVCVCWKDKHLLWCTVAVLLTSSRHAATLTSLNILY